MTLHEDTVLIAVDGIPMPYATFVFLFGENIANANFGNAVKQSMHEAAHDGGIAYIWRLAGFTPPPEKSIRYSKTMPPIDIARTAIDRVINQMRKAQEPKKALADFIIRIEQDYALIHDSMMRDAA
jgi:hypothetical protein